MYGNDLDSPPPRSILLPPDRHTAYPWSPGSYEYLPSTVGSSSNPNHSRNVFNGLQREQRRADDFDPRLLVDEYPPLPGDQFPIVRTKPQRETSEVSVEALDLADYARTLRSRQTEDPYPAFPFADASLNSSVNRVRREPPPTRIPTFLIPCACYERGDPIVDKHLYHGDTPNTTEQRHRSPYSDPREATAATLLSPHLPPFEYTSAGPKAS